MDTQTISAPTQVLDQIRSASPNHVWTPADFARFGSRGTIDKVLQRLVSANQLRRIDRGLYDRPKINKLTKRPTSPDYRAVLDALARRDQVRLLIDGLTAANDLGLTTAVPARVTIHTDTRRRSIQLDRLVIAFRPTAASRLYWAGRPGMRVVQALHWLKDTMPGDKDQVLARLRTVLGDPKHGRAIRRDLSDGFATLPSWMQPLVRELLDPTGTAGTDWPRPRQPTHTVRSKSTAHRKATKR